MVDTPNRNTFLAGLVCLIVAASPPLLAQQATEVHYRTSADDTEQSALFYAPTSQQKIPLMVALHTWSGDYQQTYHQAIEQWCVENGWAYIHPNFRGPNKRPAATGSDLVVQDIVSAVKYAQANAPIDKSAIYLVGTSGGGHAALMMAGRHPEIWAGVSAWVPISDLAAWYHECRTANLGYADDIVASCGGRPGDSPQVDKQYSKRSPLTYLKHAKGTQVHIHAGIRDGHDGSVPVSHSLRAFNQLAESQDRISNEDIRFFVEQAAVPSHLQTRIEDSSYGKKRPLFRRTSGDATVTIFKGEHELIADAALHWMVQIHSQNSKEPKQVPSPTK